MDTWSIHPNSFPMLRSLTKLRTLHIYPSCNGWDKAASVSGVVSCLRELPDLTSIAIESWRGESHAVGWLLDGLGAAVPQLRELSFSMCTLPSLASLSPCVQLRKLELTFCHVDRGDPIIELPPLLHSLRHLEDLHINGRRLTSDQRGSPPPSFISELRSLTRRYGV
jgi:hypothetical protein